MKKIAIITLALLPFALRAQDTLYGSYNESVYVQGDFRPTIEQSFKLAINPIVTDTAETMQHTFTYGITPQRVTSVFSPARLGYVKINVPPQRLYNNYIRLGMGNYWSPMADLYLHSTRNPKFKLNYGARLFHQSSWGKIGKPEAVDPLQDPFLARDTASKSYYGPNHFSTTSLNLFGKYILKERHQLSADLDYGNDYTMYYGFNDSVLANINTGHWPWTLTRDSVDRYRTGMVYNTLGFSLGAKSLHTDLNKFGYDATASINQLWGRYGMSELHYAADATVHYGFPFLKQSKGIAYLRLGYNGWQSRFTPQFDSAANWVGPYLYANDMFPYAPEPYAMDTTYATPRFILQANPYVDFIFRQWQVHAGANLAFDRFSLADSLRFCFFPDVVISTKMMSDALSLNVGFTGGIDPNDWNAIRLVNPYVMPNADERATKHWDLYGHMRLTFSKKLELNARVQYSYLKDDLNFLVNKEYLLQNVFMTDYISYSQATVGADLTFVNDEMLSATLAGHYYGYFGYDDPLHYRPNWDASLKVNVNYKDKLRLHLESLLLGKMTGEWNDANNVADILPMRYGLNLEVEYLHTRALSFFARFDNILCQRYFYWTNYPSQRLQFMLGLTYTVPHK